MMRRVWVLRPARDGAYHVGGEEDGALFATGVGFDGVVVVCFFLLTWVVFYAAWCSVSAKAQTM